MNRYPARLLGSVILASLACMFLAQPAKAENEYLTLEEAGKLGMTVKLKTPKPRVIYAPLRFTEEPQDAQMVIRGEKEKWIANTSMAIKDKTCSAYLAEEYVGKSYILVTLKPGGLAYHVPLR
jgi:hypothetical protein